MDKFIGISSLKTRHYKYIQYFCLTVFIIFSTTPFIQYTKNEEKMKTVGFNGKQIIRLINLGKKQQVIQELRSAIVYYNENHLPIPETLSSLEQLLTTDKNVKEIKLISTTDSLMRNIKFEVSPETKESYYSNSQFFVASETKERHPIMGAGCGEVYRYQENSDLYYMGKLPVTISMYKGKNRFRIYFDLLYYDLELNSTDDSISINSFSYEKRIYCAKYSYGVESRLQQLSKIMSDKSWTYKDNTPTVYIPYFSGVYDLSCNYSLSFGSQKYYRIRLSSEPLGAKVFIDGKVYGETKLEVLIRRNFGKFRLVFKKDGYFDAAYEYKANENNLIFNATLKPIKQQKK